MSTQTGDLFLFLDIASRTEQGIDINIIRYFLCYCNRVIFQENQVPRGQTKNCQLPYREVTLNYATLNPWRLK